MAQATLETDRLILRPVHMSDAPDLQRHFAHWEVIQHLSTQVPWPYPNDGVEHWLRTLILPGMAQGNLMVWAIVLRENPGEAIGILEYRCAPGTTDDRGFWIARPHQGRGYMTEAVFAFQDHVFFTLGIEELTVHNARVNTRSRRIKEKTGARFVGLVELPHHNGHSETERWIVTRERWAEIRGR